MNAFPLTYSELHSRWYYQDCTETNMGLWPDNSKFLPLALIRRSPTKHSSRACTESRGAQVSLKDPKGFRNLHIKALHCALVQCQCVLHSLSWSNSHLRGPAVPEEHSVAFAKGLCSLTHGRCHCISEEFSHFDSQTRMSLSLISAHTMGLRAHSRHLSLVVAPMLARLKCCARPDHFCMATHAESCRYAVSHCISWHQNACCANSSSKQDYCT